METSSICRASQQPLPSPDGLHIASIAASKLQIRSTGSLDVFRSVNVSSLENHKHVWFRWAPISHSQPWSYRVLLGDGDGVRVWDLRDAKWSARMDNGSGGTGKIANADFGQDQDEVIVVSEFGSKLTIWSLIDGHSVEVKDPKHPGARSYAFRPTREPTSVKTLALLCRPGAQDILVLYSSQSREVMGSINLPTHDAQGIKWSPNGRWLAVWDSPGHGFKVCIYTADGQLYRVYSGEAGEDQQLQLGVRSLEWSPDGDFIAVGGHSRRIVLLSARTFSPAMYLDHTASVQIEDGAVWQEQVPASSSRSYTAAAQPVSPPTSASSDAHLRAGISQLFFNSTGDLLPTKDESAPTAVWIWDLRSLKPRAVLLQYSNIKRLTWHPNRPDLLLVHCTHEEPVVYLWSALSDSPMVLTAPSSREPSRFECSWLSTKLEHKPAIIVGDSNGFALLWPDGREVSSEGESEDEHSVDDSLDSVVEMLAGRTPLPDTTEVGRTMRNGDDLATSALVEDTFRWKKLDCVP